MMDAVGVRKKSECLYPMLFGVSCALVAVRNSPQNEINDDKWLETKNIMLRASAHLLGLLVWRIQTEEPITRNRQLFNKLENAKNEVQELKKRRSEAAKANEKVLGIFAAHEQRWFVERKKLRQEIGRLLNELRVLEINKNDEISRLNEKGKEMDTLVNAKDKALDEIEEKLKRVEIEVHEVKKLHSSEIWKHKNAFIELVSTQTQFEADIGRALRQVEETKKELDLVLDQKKESVLMTQTLSIEVVKLRRDLEQKDKILSAMLRKSKLDTAEKQVLLNELKLWKSKRKQAEFESEKRRLNLKAKNDKHSLISILSKGAKRKAFSDVKMQSDPQKDDYVCVENLEESEILVLSEVENYAKVADEQHHLEIEAFAEQLRVKDEKLEAYQWRLMRFEIESKRLISLIEGLEQKNSCLKEENLKKETLLVDQETELLSLKTQLSNTCSQVSYLQKADIESSASHYLALTHGCFWSNVKIMKRHLGEKDQETVSFVEIPQETRVNLPNDLTYDLETTDTDFKEENREKLGSVTKNSLPWKMDLHALGVSYKIKRLKQQLVMFEKIKGKKESFQDDENGKFENNRCYSLMSLLNKQVAKYTSLQETIDDLCKRLHETNSTKTKAESKALGQFLTETFHLQKFIVSTGQKLIQLQPKIASEFINDKLEDTIRFDSNAFSNNLTTLFKEVQRGIEVRISKIIGDLEGTLACEGIMHLKM